MNEKLNAVVGARLTEFRRKMAMVKKTMTNLPKNTKLKITAVTDKAYKKVEKFQNRMDKLANTIRSFSTVGQNMLGGSLLAASPAAVPIIATLVGLLGTLGPLITVAGSNMVALAAAFGIAGGAALAFGFAAAPTIQSLVDGTAEATAENKKAMKSFESLKKVWSDIQKQIEPQTVSAFTSVMNGLESTLKSIKPMFTSVADTIADLSSDFNQFTSSTSAKQFFSYLNKNAGPTLESVVKGIGGLIKGFMNLTVAFAPLTEFASKGFQSMGEDFASFTEKIQNSKGLQNFINYVKINGPKLMAIVKNIGSGLIGMFTAFGPLASDMMTGLVNLTSRFKEWGQSLSENQQFQKFIDYIRTNAPTVLSLIGNITTTLVNLGISMAPLGQKVLEVANSFFAWVSNLLKTNPAVGDLFGKLLIGAGIFQMLLPVILSATTFFGGFGTKISQVLKLIGPAFNNFKLNFITGLNMIGVRMALFVQKVASVASKIVMNFLRMSGKAISWAAKMVAQIAKVIARFALLSLKAALHAGKVALSFMVTMVKAAAKATASMIASMAKFAAKYAWMGAKALLHAAKVATSWVIAMGPVGWVIATIVGLVALIIANWDKVKSWTSKTWKKIWGSIKDIASKIWNKITDVFNNIVDFFGGIDLFESGKAIIQSAIDGLLAMKDKIMGVVDNIVGAVRDFWPFSPAKRGPLSDIHKMDFGGPIGKSIQKAKGMVTRNMANLASMARNAFQPDLAMTDVSANAVIHTSTGTSDMGTIEKSFNAELNDFELPEREDVILEIDGHEVGRATFKYVSEYQEFEEEREESFR